MASLSLRNTLGATILLMGALGMVLALATGTLYRDLTLDNQRSAFSNLVGLKVDDLLKDLDARSVDLGLALQSQPPFMAALSSRDTDALTRLLDNQFHQYFVTAEVIKLEKLRLLSLDLKTALAQSSEGTVALTADQALCQTLLERALQRSGAERLQPLSGTCNLAGRPYQVVLVAVGGLIPRAYLEVITDPVQALIPIESALGMPVRLSLPDGRILYQSRTWPERPHDASTLFADYSIRNARDAPRLIVTVASDVTGLHRELTQTRWMVVLAASVTTLLGIILVSLLLRATALNPLEALMRQVRRVQQDRAHLGEAVSVSGTTEIRELANGFNEMSSELKDLYQALERMAFTDPLTKLPNRTRFHERLHDATMLGRRRPYPFALLLMDLNRFKGVNDTLGHHVGDYLLQMVGLRLESVLRDGDALQRLDSESVATVDGRLVARLGGDEFAAILDAVDNREDAIGVAMKLLRVMEEPFVVEGHHFNIGMSIGIVLSPDHGGDKNTLMRRADIAMYNAKQTQRGYAFYDSDEDHHSLLNLTLEHDLRHAIEQGGLELYFQPKFDVKSGAICGAEALARWPHAQRGFISPDQFIPLAEQTGLIHPLTLWVLENALERCAQWHRAGYQLSVAVNLSAVNFHDPDITRQVDEALHHAGLEPRWLTLELTESTLMSNPDDAVRVLSELDAMGVNLAIDDFGTGYSSLSYLRRLPVDELKIDKSFVIEMKDNPNDTVIVSATIDLAHNMGLRVVAEGVEDDAVLQRLRALDCEMAQGYSLSHPLPNDQFMRLLEQSRRPEINTAFRRAGIF